MKKITYLKQFGFRELISLDTIYGAVMCFHKKKKTEEKVIPCLKNLFWASKNPGAVFFRPPRLPC